MDTPPTAAPAWALPHNLGPYQLLRLLGQGGMGVVYEARDVHSQERVAIKVAREQEHALARIRAEVGALKQVRHPGIVRFITDGLGAGAPYYAMELLEGESWRQYHEQLWKGARLAPDAQVQAANGKLAELLQLGLGLSHALAHLHALGWVHCDLSPGNVFIRSDGSTCLMDLGLASRHGGAVGREALESVDCPMGTAGFMAPEQALGSAVDARADLYALGAMLYWSLTGRLPASELEPPSARVFGVPPALDALVVRLLAADPVQRVVTALDAAQVLTSVSGLDSPRPLASAGQLFRSRVFGRKDVLRALHRLVGGLSERGQAVFVGGVSGVGKTTVAMAAARFAVASSARVVTGACVPLEPSGGSGRLGRRAPPFAPLQPLLQAIVDHLQSSPEGATAEACQHLHFFADYDARIAELLGSRPPEPELTGEALKSRLCFDLAALLALLSRVRPLVVVLDDLQWADDLTLGFLYSLSSKYLEQTRILFLSTYRSEESDPVLQALVARPSCQDFSLSPLVRQDVDAMMRDMLGFAPPGHWSDTLHQRSGGNPFAVAEYLREALEEGRLAAGAAGAAPPPESLDALIRRRFARLSAAERLVVELAAVLGHPLSRRVLQDTAGGSATELAEQLERLVALNLFELQAPDQYRFVHDKLREHAYANMDVERRRMLHLRAGRAIEAAFGAGAPLATELPILAHHFARGGEVERAIHYLQAAAEAAHQSFANREVVALVTEALALVAETASVRPERLWRWHFLIGCACFGLGRLRESHTHLSQMLRLLRLRTPAHGLRGAWQVLAELGRQLAHRVLRPELVRPEERDWVLAAVTAHDLLMQVCFFDDHAGGTLCSALASLNLAERAGPSSELALAAANVQSTVAMLGLERLSRRYESIGLAAGSAARDRDRLSSAMVRRCAMHLITGRWAESERYCEQIIEDARAMHHERKEGEGLVTLAFIRYVQGSFVESRKIYERLHSLAASRGDTQALCWSFTGLAYAELIQGSNLSAADNARAGLCLAGHLPGRSEAINLHAVLALASLRLGDATRAEQAALTALELGRNASLVNFLDVLPWSLLAEVFHLLTLEAPRPGLLRASRLALRSLRRCARFIRFARPRAYLWDALARWQRQRWRSGTAALEKGLREAQALAMPYEQAYIELLLGTRPELASESRQVALRHAAERFAALGADFDARAIRSALASQAPPEGGVGAEREPGRLQLHALSIATALQGRPRRALHRFL